MRRPPRLAEWRRRTGFSGGYGPWLRDRGSLTRRIKARCRDFAVRGVRQTRGPKGALHREVFLCCGERPVVYAYSVLPTDSLRGPWRNLGRLGSTPLGEVLFSDSRVKRAPLVFARLGVAHPLVRRAGAKGPLWARSSLFRLAGRPIRVTEVFLPAILGL